MAQDSDQERQTRTVQRSNQKGRTAGWITVLVGIWVLITPFFWGATGGAGAWGGGGTWLYWSNVISGIVVAILAGYSSRSGGRPTEESTTA